MLIPSSRKSLARRIGVWLIAATGPWATSGIFAASEELQAATLLIAGNAKKAALLPVDSCTPAVELPLAPAVAQTSNPKTIPAGARLVVAFDHEIPDHKSSKTCVIAVSFVPEAGQTYIVHYRRLATWSKNLLGCEATVFRQTTDGKTEVEPTALGEPHERCPL